MVGRGNDGTNPGPGGTASPGGFELYAPNAPVGEFCAAEPQMQVDTENVMDIHKQLEVMREQRLRDENEVNSETGETMGTMGHVRWRESSYCSPVPLRPGCTTSFHDSRLPYNLIIKTIFT